ncbi:hypothetical protein ACW3RE_004750, partial [Shigella sonnei]
IAEQFSKKMKKTFIEIINRFNHFL